MTSIEDDLAEMASRLKREAVDFRGAPAGRGPRAYDWADKPHRLCYDAASLMDDAAELLSRYSASKKTEDEK